MKTNHSTFLIMAILVMLVTASVYFYMYSTINVSFEKTIKAKNALNSALLAKERESNFMQTYEKTASKWEKLQSFFIESNKVVDFIESVELLGSQSGSKLAIRSIEADNLDSAVAGKEGTIRLRINTQGSWQSVMKALSLAEILPYKVFVNNVQATVSKDTSELVKSGVIKESSKSVWDLNFELHATMIATGSTSPSVK